jgi:hypothetical protein
MKISIACFKFDTISEMFFSLSKLVPVSVLLLFMRLALLTAWVMVNTYSPLIS